MYSNVCSTVDRGSMQMVFTPYDLFSWNKRNMKVNSITHIIYINYMVLFLGKIPHSVRADPSSSRPTRWFLLILVHVVPALVEHWLLISLASWGAGPPLPPFPKLTQFPSGPRQHPASMSGTIWTSTRFAYSCLSIGFLKSYCHHRCWDLQNQIHWLGSRRARQ
jgi:hypothetical protein